MALFENPKPCGSDTPVRRSCIPKFLSFRAKKILCEAKDLRSRGTCFLSAARRTRGDGRAQSKMAPAVIAASTASGEVFLGGPVLATGAENGAPCLERNLHERGRARLQPCQTHKGPFQRADEVRAHNHGAPHRLNRAKFLSMPVSGAIPPNLLIAFQI